MQRAFYLVLALSACAVDVETEDEDLDEVELESTVPPTTEFQLITSPWSSRESRGIGEDVQYKLAAPANSSVVFTMTQDVDPYYQGSVYLIVRRAALPTLTTYDCYVQISSYTTGVGTGSCSFRESTGATYYVLLHTGRRYEADFTARTKLLLVNASN